MSTQTVLKYNSNGIRRMMRRRVCDPGNLEYAAGFRHCSRKAFVGNTKRDASIGRLARKQKTSAAYDRLTEIVLSRKHHTLSKVCLDSTYLPTEFFISEYFPSRTLLYLLVEQLLRKQDGIRGGVESLGLLLSAREKALGEGNTQCVSTSKRRRPSCSTIGKVGDTTIPPPGWSPKQPLPGIGLHDPLHGWQACPEFTSFHQGVGQICLREGLFSCRPLPKRGQIYDVPDPPNR